MIGSCNDSATQPFAKTICSICYDDLKPIVEDLQAISICGHVFHELCIQQWFGYCSKGKKKCPICKQTCSSSDMNRLYFQSVDPNLSQNLQTHKDHEELELEVTRLEGKISMLNSALKSQENNLHTINKEWKKEELLKNEAMEQTRKINHLLDSKTKDIKTLELKCDNLKLKCSNLEMEHNLLQEKNMDLAKELAALKLVLDVNLEEDEIIKLASLGAPHISVDILVKSLVVRNKTYNELITKYNNLARDEAHSRKELEKAKGKLEELEKKERSRKMKVAKEMNDNEVSRLRAVKASKKTKESPRVLKGVDLTFIDTCTPQDTIKEPGVHLRNTKRLRVIENAIKSNNKDDVSSYILIDDDTSKASISTEFPSYNDSVPQPTNIINEAPSPVLNSQEADSCFSAGLLGPDGAKRYLGRWCRTGQNKDSYATSMSKSSGDLIAVGADGRGGTIKVLKSLNPPSNASRGSSFSAKNSKLGAKSNSLQSQGCLQIGHYFSKTG